MNKIELSLSKELAGLMPLKARDSWDVKDSSSDEFANHFTIEDLLEILRERGFDFNITGWSDRGKFWVVSIRRPNIDKGIAPRYTGDTLKEALLRACIAVLKEVKDER